MLGEHALSPATAGSPNLYGTGYTANLGRSTISVGVTYRDFAPASSGGHVDFGLEATGGAARYAGITGALLDADRRPAFASTGFKINSQAMDSSGRPIAPSQPYISSKPGDTAAQLAATPGGAVMGSPSFSSWYRTTPGVNTSSRSLLDFTRQAGGEYLLDQTLDGCGGSADYDYTAEVGFVFVHEAGGGGYLTAETDAEVWVYIDGRMVIDGGAAGASSGGHIVGIACDGLMTFNSNAAVRVAPGGTATVATNATGDDEVVLNAGSDIYGDLMVGPGGNPSDVIKKKNNATITGAIGTLTEPIQMPVITIPSGFGASVGDISIATNTTIGNQMIRCDAFEVNNARTLTIDGDVKIWCDDFTLNSSADLEMNAGASLEIYVDGAFLVNSASKFNHNTQDPGLVTVFVLGATDPEINSASGAYLNMAAPSAMLKINSSSFMGGNFIGRAVEMNSSSDFLVMDTGPWGGAMWGSGGGVPAMRQTIELDRLDWLEDLRPYPVEVFFANRSGKASNLMIETNITSVNSINTPLTVLAD